MGTMEQFEARLRPYKIALVEAFGLNPDHTSSNVSAGHDVVTFMLLGGHAEAPAPAITRGTDHNGVITVEFEALHWTDAQRKAVSDYISQFPVQP